MFNDSFIDGKLDKIVSPQKQLKIIKGLNRLAAAFAGMLRKRWACKVVRKRRDAMFVCIADIINMVK